MLNNLTQVRIAKLRVYGAMFMFFWSGVYVGATIASVGQVPGWLTVTWLSVFCLIFAFDCILESRQRRR